MAGKSAQNSNTPLTTVSQKRTLLIISVVFAILLILAASGFAIKQTSKDGSSDVIEEMSGNGSETNVVTEDGDVKIREGRLPSGFPEDVSFFAKSEVGKTTESAEGMTVELETKESVKVVTTFYESDLKSTGWKKISRSYFKNSSLITAQKGKRQILIDTKLDSEKGRTTINIAVSTPN